MTEDCENLKYEIDKYHHRALLCDELADYSKNRDEHERFYECYKDYVWRRDIATSRYERNCKITRSFLDMISRKKNVS